MKKTMAEILNELERRSKEIEKAGTFKGNNTAVADILLAGLEMMAEGYENK